MRFIVALVFSLLAFKLAAQQAPGLQDVVVDSARYMPAQHYTAFGVGYKTTKDLALSPLVFQGTGLTFTTSRWKYNGPWLWQSTFGAGLYLLQNAPASSLLSSASLHYQLAALRELKAFEKKQWRFWVGPEAGIFGNIRMHSNNTNNIAAYDVVTTLGVSGMLSKKFSLWNRSFAFSNQLHLPLLYLYARPPYAWGIPPAIYEGQQGSWKEAFQTGTLNHLFLFRNELNLDFYLRRKKKGKLIRYTAYRMAYSWSYFQVTTRNQLQSGGHVLSLSRIVSF